MAVRPPSLRAIAAFEAAARLGSFAKAATELNLSQSAVSHAVRTLEDRLGEPLFERGKNAVALTQAGATLASRVRLSLGLLNEAFGPESTHEKTKLVVSALSSVASRLLVPRLASLFEQLPNIELELHVTRRLADVKSSEADVAIRFGRGQWPGLTSQLLAKDTVFPVAAPHYRGGRLPEQLSDLTDCEIIIHPAISWRFWLEAAGSRVERLNGSLHTDDSLLMIEAAIAGQGVALVNGHLVEEDLASGRLVKLFGVEVEDDYAHWVVWDSSSPRLAEILPFVGWLTAEFSQLADRTL